MKNAFLLFLLFPLSLSAQQLSRISTVWGDSFVEWELYAFTKDSAAIEEAVAYDEPIPEEPVGELKLRWLNVRDDFSEWDYEYMGYRGTIQQKWKDDPTFWELRDFDGTIVSMRVSWKNDLTEWRVTDNTITLNFRSRWKNQLNEWQVEDREHGNYYIWALNGMDPRDWGIDDQFYEEVPGPMRLALVFLAVYHSTPKQ